MKPTRTWTLERTNKYGGIQIQFNLTKGEL